MKQSLKEALCAAHQHVTPDLDLLRARAVAEAFRAPSDEVRSPRPVVASSLGLWWHELFWSVRAAWAGIAAAWVAIALLNQLDRPVASAMARSTTLPQRQLMEMVLNPQRVVDQLDWRAVSEDQSVTPSALDPRSSLNQRRRFTILNA